MNDPLDTLRALRADDGSTAHELQEAILERGNTIGPTIYQIITDLDRYRHDGLVEIDKGTHGSISYSISAEGNLVLAEADGVRAEAEPEGFDLGDAA